MTAYSALLSIVWGFNFFDLIYATTSGGPFARTETLVVLAQRMAFKVLDLGYTSALGVMWLLILMVFTGMVLPFSIWMIKSFCDTIDKDLEDAAIIDGASRFRILWNIVVPMITPGIASVAMFSFLASWNHLLYVMILNTRETLLTVPMGLVREYSSQYDYYYATLSAGLLLIIIPIAIVYIPFQKYYASGLTMGAVKG